MRCESMPWSSRPFRAACAAAVAVLALVPLPSPAQSDTSTVPPRAVAQRGVLEVNGCTLQARDILLTAAPMLAEGVDYVPPSNPPQGPDPARLPLHQARVTATDDPNVFNFVVHGLKVTTPYVLDVKIPDGRCPKTTWIGPKRGVIAPGAQESIRIRGFALTTRIDVESEGGAVLRAADFLRFDPLGSDWSGRRFRLVTDLPDATGFELQIATERFRPDSETAATCGSPRGLIYRLPLAAAGVGATFTPAINFDQFLNPGEYEPAWGSSAAAFTDELGGEVSLNEATRLAIEGGAPMYVRAIPTRADGMRLCERLRHGAAAHSIVAYIAAAETGLSTQPSLLTSGEYRPAQSVDASDFCVTVVKPHTLEFRLGDLIYDAQFLKTAQAQNGVVQPGDYTCWDKSESVIDDVGDFLSGFVDAVASVVNYVARLYNDIKAEIVAFAGDAIEFVGIPCDESCRGFLDTALTTALVAMGVPPSLPDFDALVNEGVDYVKGYVASQAGIPGPVADAAEGIVRAVVAEAKENQGGDGLPDWLVYDNRFRPAVVVLDVTRNPLAPLQASGLRVQASPVPMFLEARVPFPLEIDNARVPVVLPPDLTNLPDGCVNHPIFVGQRICPPLEVQQKRNLALWFDTRFAASICADLKTQQFLGGPIFGSVQTLATHTVAPLFPATFGPLDSDDCYY